MKFTCCFIFSLLLIHQWTYGQNYRAIHGSVYSSSLNVTNNPASIVNSPTPWDVTLMSFQYQAYSNALKTGKRTFFKSPAGSTYELNPGNFRREMYGNVDVHLLNARIALSQRKAIAFGANIRGYGQVKTGRFNYEDSLTSMGSFLSLNENNVFEGKLESSAWIEMYASYGLTIHDRSTDRLNAAVTLKALRGISGAMADIANISSNTINNTGMAENHINNGNARYGYSSNYDSWRQTRNTTANIKDFLQRSNGSLSLDLGLEYIIKTQAVPRFDDEEHYYEYKWKIGLALLDLGWNQFAHSNNSRSVSNLRANISGTVLQDKFVHIRGIQSFNDSLSTIVNNINTLPGKFRIINPARMILQIDRHLHDDFYINGELSVNLSSLAGETRLKLVESNVVSITPRWENRRMGAYLPLQYNRFGQFRIGAAIKYGPLLLGLHNLFGAFQNNNRYNRGGYLAIIISPSKITSKPRYKRLDCPEL